jgi:hypothetical protein
MLSLQIREEGINTAFSSGVGISRVFICGANEEKCSSEAVKTLNWISLGRSFSVRWRQRVTDAELIPFVQRLSFMLVPSLCAQLLSCSAGAELGHSAKWPTSTKRAIGFMTLQYLTSIQNRATAILLWALVDIIVLVTYLLHSHFQALMIHENNWFCSCDEHTLFFCLPQRSKIIHRKDIKLQPDSCHLACPGWLK